MNERKDKDKKEEQLLSYYAHCKFEKYRLFNCIVEKKERNICLKYLKLLNQCYDKL